MPLTADQRRIEALKAAFECSAAALLGGANLDKDAVVLFIAAMVDAAIAGDRNILRLTLAIFERLEHYGGEAAGEIDLITLSVLEHMAAFSLLALEGEYSETKFDRP